MTPADKSALPTGSVTFLFTDIGGSTRLFRQTGDRWPALLARHDALLTDAFKASGGHVLSHDGDGYFVAFSSIDDAVKATVQAQRSLADEPWPDDAVIKVRAGMHTGYAVPRDGSYVERAAELFTQGLRLGHRMADTELMTYAVLGLAMVAEGRGDVERSARLHGVTDSLLQQLQMELDALEERLRQRSISRLEVQAGASAVAAWRLAAREGDANVAIAAELAEAAATPNSRAPLLRH